MWTFFSIHLIGEHFGVSTLLEYVLNVSCVHACVREID